MDMLEKITTILENKKAMDIKTVEVKEKTTLTDYFVIVSGTSNTHVKALADNVEYELKKEQIVPNKVEGYQTGTWILMDYGKVIIHIFTAEEREKYNLEDLWEKAKNME